MTIEMEEYGAAFGSRAKLDISNQRLCSKVPMSIPKAPPPTPTTARLLATNSGCFHDFKNGLAETLYLIPRIVPELKTTSTNPARRSEIRYTLSNRLESAAEKKDSQLDSKNLISLSFTSENISNKKQLTNADLIKVVSDQTQTDVAKNAAFNDSEKNAASVLLSLKKCSLEVSNMAQRWTMLQNIPLCDFIVAQKKCEAILDNINTLKVGKINARNRANNVLDDCQIPCTADVPHPKRNKLNDILRAKSRSCNNRSSSIITIVNKTHEGENSSKQHGRSNSIASSLAQSPLLSSSISPPYIRLQSPVNIESSRVPGDGTSDVRESRERKCDNNDLLENLNRRNSIKFGKSSKSGKNRNAHMRCLHCSATDTPEWRKGPRGPATLCNACGLFYKKLIRKFGVLPAGSVMSQRQTKNPQDRKVPRIV